MLVRRPFHNSADKNFNFSSCARTKINIGFAPILSVLQVQIHFSLLKTSFCILFGFGPRYTVLRQVSSLHPRWVCALELLMQSISSLLQFDFTAATFLTSKNIPCPSLVQRLNQSEWKFHHRNAEYTLSFQSHRYLTISSPTFASVVLCRMHTAVTEVIFYNHTYFTNMLSFQVINCLELGQKKKISLHYVFLCS